MARVVVCSLSITLFFSTTAALALAILHGSAGTPTSWIRPSYEVPTSVPLEAR